MKVSKNLPDTLWHVKSLCQHFGATRSPTGGDVEFHVLDETGQPLSGVDVILFGNSYSIETTAMDGVARINLYDRQSKAMDVNNIAAVVEEPSDRVEGLMLPDERPMTFEIVFQRAKRKSS